MRNEFINCKIIESLKEIETNKNGILAKMICRKFGSLNAFQEFKNISI